MTEIATRAGQAVDLASAPLKDVENYIAPRLKGFVEAGLALMAIRERRLYLNAGWDTFEAYCRDRWQIDDRSARRMCDAAQVAHLTSSSTDGPIEPAVENEAQARELAPLLGRPDELRAVWRATVERTGGAVTAAAIRAVRREFEARRNPPPQSPTPVPSPVPAPSRPPASQPEPAPAPRPAHAKSIPADAQRVFVLITQACEETRGIGGTEVFRSELSPAVREAWAAQLAACAAYVAGLADACEAGGS